MNDNNVKAQGLIYRFKDGKIECLCLKRSQEDGGFWHIITGTKENNENDEQVLIREIEEELGLDLDDSDLVISDLINLWDWNKNGVVFKIREYFIFLKKNSDIILNDEHDEFIWLSPKKAFNLLEKDSAKRMVNNLIESYLYE